MNIEYLSGAYALRRIKKTLLCCLVSGMLFVMNVLPLQASPAVEAPSYLLMEASTGRVICEQNADERRSPASITKIMTLLLIFEHLNTGRITLDSQVVTSAHAKSMGGSQVFDQNAGFSAPAMMPVFLRLSLLQEVKKNLCK